MEKIIVLTYYFPPSKYTAASRPYSWFKYLHLFGYYPIVVTIDWDGLVGQGTSDVFSHKVLVQQQGEVHFLPLEPSIKERLSSLGFASSLAGKAFTFWELIIQNYTIRFLPYRNLMTACEKLLNEYPEIRLLITTANPYSLFSMASQLTNRYPRLRWVADYRDDWSTKRLNRKRSFFHTIVYSLESESERRWLASSACFTSVSEVLINRIASFIQKEGFLIANGFFEEDYDHGPLLKEKGRFIVCYTGILYPEQQLDQFLLIFKRVREKYDGRVELILRFIGPDAYPEGMTRLLACIEGADSYVEIFPMVSREECIQLEASADMLLMMAYGTEKGIPSSKLFQYLGHKLPIMVYPGDEDIIDYIVSEDTQLGQRLTSPEQAVAFLSEHIEAKLTGEAVHSFGMQTNVFRYSRRAQTEKLAQLLNSIIH